MNQTHHVNCPCCAQNYEVAAEQVGMQIQCSTCLSYFTIPTLEQSQHQIAQVTLPMYQSAPVVPKWYATLTIMGPLCACLLLIGGGVTYYLTRNKTVIKEENIVQIEPVVNKYEPAPEEPQLNPEPLAMSDPVKISLPPLEPEPEAPKPLPNEVTLGIEILSVSQDYIRKRPDLLMKSSEEIHELLISLKKNKSIAIIYDQDFAITCNQKTVLGRTKENFKSPEQAELLYLNKFRAGANGELIQTGKNVRIIGLGITADYSPTTSNGGTISLSFENVSKEVAKRQVPSGGKDAWFPQFDSIRFNGANIKITRSSPSLVGSFHSAHKILASSSVESRFYFLFVTLK